MANKLDLKKLMNERAPKRKAIVPVDIYAVATSPKENRTVDRTPNRTVDRTTERSDEHPTERSVVPNDRTLGTHATHTSVLDELEAGVKTEARPTERYSFEAYSDQVEKLAKIQALYRERTKSKVTVSRLIRDALDAYLVKFKDWQ